MTEKVEMNMSINKLGVWGWWSGTIVDYGVPCCASIKGTLSPLLRRNFHVLHL